MRHFFQIEKEQETIKQTIRSGRWHPDNPFILELQQKYRELEREKLTLNEIPIWTEGCTCLGFDNDKEHCEIHYPKN
jgi:hypothetical protein